MSLVEREELLALLDAEEDFYIITCLKKQPKNFKLTSIRKEVAAYERILPLATCAMRILPMLNLFKTAIHYYSSLVDHYTVQGLTRINENQTCLWLLCFVHQRYRLMLDNLATMLIYTCNQYTTDIEKKASELLVVELKKPDDQGWQIAKTLRVFRSPETDFTKAFSYIKDDVHVFFPPDKMDHAIDVLEDNNKALKALEAKCFWLAVDELVATYKQPLRLLGMVQNH